MNISSSGPSGVKLAWALSIFHRTRGVTKGLRGGNGGVKATFCPEQN